MKSVGKLCEFIKRPETTQSDMEPALYISRRILLSDNKGTQESTALLLPGMSVESPVPSVLVYRADIELERLVNQQTQTAPDVTVVTDNNSVEYQLWRIDSLGASVAIRDRLDQLSEFYVLDGWTANGDWHHSSHTLLLADGQLQAVPCHRLLADLAGMDDYEFLQRLQKCFNIRVASDIQDAMPNAARAFGLYVAGCWYQLRLIEGTWFHADPVADLDVSVVHDNMLAPLLKITGNYDGRIAYTGPACDVQTLQHLVDSGQWQAVWLMPAPAIDQLMHISDLGRSMPENTVCFQPFFDSAVLAAIKA